MRTTTNWRETLDELKEHTQPELYQEVLGIIERLSETANCLSDKNRALTTELIVNRIPAKKEETDGPDQTAKQDDGKLDLTLVPTAIIWCIAAIRKFGLTKYKDPMNWKRVEKARLRAAAFRHFLKYLRDPEKLDEESGLPHLWHCATNIDFLCELEHYDIEGCTW